VSTEALILIRQEWEEGNRRLESERGDARRYRRLVEQVELVVDELRKQVGQTYTLAQLADAYRDADRRCLKRNARLLPHVSTANVARDMDLLRQALGESRLTYLGASYGTYLGTTYANLFPDRVRALALDGAVDPVAYATGRDDEADRVPTFTRMMSHVGASETLAQFLHLCADAGPSRCPFAVETDRQATTGRFDAVMARLREHPLPVVTPQGTVQLTYARVVSAVGGNLSFQAAFPTLALALQQLDQGDGTLMAGLGQFLTPPTSYDNSHEAGAAVICADSDNPESPLDWPPAARAADRQAPYFGSPFAYGSFACGDWKVRDRDRYVGPFNRPTANPILVVGTTFDPATPYAGAVALTHHLANARLLTLNGWGHTALGQPSTCAHEAEVRYLVDLTLPAPDLVCKPDIGPFEAVPSAIG